MARFSAIGVAVATYGFLAVTAGLAQVNVLTQHNDNFRTGQNISETVLTPANVKTGSFGKLFSQAVDGAIYAQPLYMSGVNIPSQGIHNVVYVATENSSVYAFDADNNQGANSKPLWTASFTDPVRALRRFPVPIKGAATSRPRSGSPARRSSIPRPIRSMWWPTRRKMKPTFSACTRSTWPRALRNSGGRWRFRAPMPVRRSTR